MDKKAYRASGVVLSSWLAVFCLFGYRATFAVLKDPVRISLGWTDTQVTTGYSLMMVIYALTAYFSGVILDKKGSKPVYLIACVMGSLGFFFTSLTSSHFLYLISFGFFGGVATGLLWVSSTVSVRKWFVGRKYATYWGIAFSGAPVAQFLLVRLTRSVLNRPDIVTDSWRDAMQILSLVIFIALFVAFLLAKKDPESYHYKPFGENNSTKDIGRDWTLKEAFSSKPVWCVMLMFLTSMIAEFLIWTQLVSYWTVDLKWSADSAARTYGAIGIAGFFLMPAIGYCADLLVGRTAKEVTARRIMLVIGPSLGVIAGIIIFLVRDLNITVYLSLILFASYWAIVPGGVVGYTGAVYGRNNLGRIWGLATLLVMGTGPFLGSFIGSLLYDISKSYDYSLLFAIISFALSAFLALILPQGVKRSKSSGSTTA